MEPADWRIEDHPNKTWCPPKSPAHRLQRGEFKSRRQSVSDALKYRPKHADLVREGYARPARRS